MSNDQATVISGARVYTADRARPWAGAVAVRGNRILAVGMEAEVREAAGSGAEEIRATGGLVIPGLNDSHVHMTMGAYDLTILDLEGVVTLEELQRRIREYGAAHPDKEWIEGYALPYEPMTGLGRPERVVLDEAVADRPVYVRAFDGHSSWANSEALRRAGIERGADIPRPSEVVVDPGSGMATGMLKEKLAHALVAREMGEPTQDDRDNQLCRAMGFMNRFGITSVQNMDGDISRLQQYRRLEERGDLSVRAYHYMSTWEDTPADYVETVAEYVREYRSPWNRTSGIKLFIDGVVESKTACMLEPYSDGSGDVGVPDIDPAIFRRFIVAADKLDLDVATHAIGDRGVRLTLDAYQAAQEANGGRRDRRHRVEHIETIHPSDIPRFGKMGITASMQPLHAAPTTDPRYTPWTLLVGPQREVYSFGWRNLLETGARLSFGSDWPIVTPDVRLGIHTALTRQNRFGEPEGGWQPQLTITLAQALDAYTSGAAYIERQEDVKGMLRPGMLADITVFEKDLFAMTPGEIRGAEVALTMVDGRLVHRASL